MPEPKQGFIGEQIFTTSRVPRDYVLHHLYKIFSGVLYSIENQDEEFLNEYCEKNFSDKLMKNLKYYKSKGFIVKVETDLSGISGEPV